MFIISYSFNQLTHPVMITIITQFNTTKYLDIQVLILRLELRNTIVGMSVKYTYLSKNNILIVLSIMALL